MQAEVDAGLVDLVLHPGDVSYADGDMPHWDSFLSKVQRITSVVPYMVTPGNHEIWYNFSAYKTQFWTPVRRLHPAPRPPASFSNLAGVSRG